MLGTAAKARSLHLNSMIWYHSNPHHCCSIQRGVMAFGTRMKGRGILIKHIRACLHSPCLQGTTGCELLLEIVSFIFLDKTLY